MILYIPHGSDETYYTLAHIYSYMSFISHMVQMKLICDRGIMAEITLYIPHGSDETYCPCFVSPFYFIFISHMVQMKHFDQNKIKHVILALYPTWFR